jgi:hypothetical protein
MRLSDFVYNPVSFLFQAIKYYLYTRVRIYTRLNEYEIRTEFKDQNDIFFEFRDWDDTSSQIRGPAMDFTLKIINKKNLIIFMKAKLKIFKW